MKGYGFVKFAFPDDAIAAKAALHGADIKGRCIQLESALK